MMGLNYDSYRKGKNFFMLSLIVASLLIVMVPFIYIFMHILKNGISSLSWEFFTEMPRPIGESGGGIKHAIYGTFYMLLIGGLFGSVWGLLVGIYLSEFGHGRSAQVLRLTTDLLSGTPSIVIGLFAYALLVVPLKGFSALAGGVALGLIILPIVIRNTEIVLKLVPLDIREAGLALGLSRFKVIFHLVVWGNRSKLLTGILLALSRASGETAPLLFTAFGNMHLSFSPMAPMASLPLQIYTYAISPYEDWHEKAWGGALLLIILVFVFNLTAKLFAHYSQISNRIKEIIYEHKHHPKTSKAGKAEPGGPSGK